MASSVSRADGRRRRDSLLDAALECFNEEGILSTGIEQIRRRAGASPSSVYHHFGGLNDLSAALLLRTFERAIGRITEEVLATDTAEDGIRTLVRAYLEWVLAHPDEARFMYQATTIELGGSRQRDVLEAKVRLYEPLAGRFSGLAEAGELPPWPWTALSAVVLGPSQDVCRRMLAGDPLDREWALAELPGVAWRSVRPA